MGIKEIYQNVVNGQIPEVEEGIQSAITNRISAVEILTKALVPAMDEVGQRFEEGSYFIPEMLISAQAMKCGMRILKPHLVNANVKPTGIVAIGTVKGDIHDIGKNLVAMMLEGNGFVVIDLGIDVSPEVFVRVVREGVQLIGMSAMLTTTMRNMEINIRKLETEGVRNLVSVFIGGAPITEEYAKAIGADGFAPDASSAVRVARQLLAK